MSTDSEPTIAHLVRLYDRLTMQAFGPSKGRLDEAKLRGQFAHWRDTQGASTRHIERMIRVFAAQSTHSGARTQDQFTSAFSRAYLRARAEKDLASADAVAMADMDEEEAYVDFWAHRDEEGWPAWRLEGRLAP